MLFTKHSCLEEGSFFPLSLLVTTRTGEQTLPDRILQSRSVSGPFCPCRKKPLCYRWLVVSQCWRQATEDEHPCPHPGASGGPVEALGKAWLLISPANEGPGCTPERGFPVVAAVGPPDKPALAPGSEGAICSIYFFLNALNS